MKYFTAPISLPPRVYNYCIIYFYIVLPSIDLSVCPFTFFDECQSKLLTSVCFPFKHIAPFALIDQSSIFAHSSFLFLGKIYIKCKKKCHSLIFEQKYLGDFTGIFITSW